MYNHILLGSTLLQWVLSTRKIHKTGQSICYTLKSNGNMFYKVGISRYHIFSKYFSH